jgi:ribosomal-protein-alanine N-acetyltransferase
MQERWFDPFPCLGSTHLRCRQLRPADAPEIFILRSDEAVNAYLDRPRAYSEAEALAFIESIDQAITSNRSILWAISLQGEDRLVGTICLWNITGDRFSAEIGYELLPSFQGKKIMQEAIALILAFGFTQMKLSSITAEVRRDNHRSVRLLGKNGFREVQDSPHQFKPTDAGPDMVTYRITRTTWSDLSGQRT